MAAPLGEKILEGDWLTVVKYMFAWFKILCMNVNAQHRTVVQLYCSACVVLTRQKK